MEELRKPFEEDSMDLFTLDTKKLLVLLLLKLSERQKGLAKSNCHYFMKEHLLSRMKSIDDTIHQKKPKPHEQKQQRNSLKNSAELFSRLYIHCQVRDRDLDNAGHRRQKPSELFRRDLKERSKAPVTTTVILDGSVIAQMLKHAVYKNFK